MQVTKAHIRARPIPHPRQSSIHISRNVCVVGLKQTKIGNLMQRWMAPTFKRDDSQVSHTLGGYHHEQAMTSRPGLIKTLKIMA